MDFFSQSALADLEILPVLVNLVLVLLLGQILSLHYVRFAKVLSNKTKFAPMLIFISATTMLVISVVKTSLALSLGLVGALSIIRFRTPIKEAEELAYLFLAVALGIGIGADQRLTTAVMMLVILIYMAFLRRGGTTTTPARTLLHVDAALGSGNAESALEQLLAQLTEGTRSVDLRRMDTREDRFEASLVLDVEDERRIGGIVERVRASFPGASVSVVEAASLD